MASPIKEKLFQGNLHCPGFILPHGGTCVVITPLSRVPRGRRGNVGRKHGAGPAQGSPAHREAAFWPALSW